MLTRREREVAAALLEGYSDKEIAESTGINYATVKLHMHHIRNKTGMDTRLSTALYILRTPAVLAEVRGGAQ